MKINRMNKCLNKPIRIDRKNNLWLKSFGSYTPAHSLSGSFLLSNSLSPQAPLSCIQWHPNVLNPPRRISLFVGMQYCIHHVWFYYMGSYTRSMLICLGCNKDLWSRRSKYKSYGALRVWSGGKGSSPGVVYGKDSGIVRQCDVMQNGAGWMWCDLRCKC